MSEKVELSIQKNKALIKKIIVRFTMLPVILSLIIFVPAGTINYWQVYAYFAVILIPMIFIIRYFVKKDLLFLERRLKTREREKQQKIIQVAFTIIFFMGYIVSGLDKRFGWSDIPFPVVLIVDVVILTGYIIVFYVFKQNSYASRVVEVEQDQKVISTGLYSIVRHPMYIGILIMYIPTPIAIGSFWGLIPILSIPIALVLRILNEEKVLNEELNGYKEYCQKTKYRLIPYVW